MKLAYREFGSGTPLIILHGLFGQSDNWNTLAKKFAAEGFYVLTVDQRNHGLSPHSDTWNYEVMAQDLRELIEDKQIENPILLGHSMGAKTVLFFEKDHPGLASKIIIADMAAREYPPDHASVLDALNAVDFDKIKNRKEAEAVMTEYISDFGTRQFLLKNIYWKDSENEKMDWRFNLPVISKYYDNVRESVPFFKSKVPTLILKGEKSNYIDEKDEKDFQSRFSDCTIKTINGAGHWVHAEKPEQFFEEVMGFLSS